MVTITDPGWKNVADGSNTWGAAPAGGATWGATAGTAVIWDGILQAPPVVILPTNAILGEDGKLILTEDGLYMVLNDGTEIPQAAQTPPLKLIVSPSTQTIPIQSAGPVSTVLNYQATGGQVPYAFVTSAPGLTVVGGDTPTPTLSTILTLGQDTTYPVVVTVTDGQGAAATATASVEFKTLAASTPLSLVISPTSTVKSRVGPGVLSAGVTYAASGGTGLGYMFATTVNPSATVTGGNTATPSISATLADLQDTVFTVTGTLTDSSGASITTTATIELKATAVPVGLSVAINPSSQKLTRQGPGAISTAPGGITYSATGGSGTGYTYSTSVSPTATITGGTTPSPVLSATLIAQQDTVFTITATVTDSLGATATQTATVEFQATLLPLSLAISPASQVKSVSGPGTLTTTVNYTPAGGNGIYSFATNGGGTTVANGNTATPTLSATLTQGQDNHYTVTGTLTDSAGSTPATATAAIEFKSTIPGFDPMVLLASGMNADNIALNTASFASSPYAQTDMDVFKAMGITYFRIPMDISFIMTGFPVTGDKTGKISDAAFCDPILQHIEDVMTLMISNGFGVVPALFIDPALRDARGLNGTFNSMMTGAMSFMANRWMTPLSAFYRPPTQLILNLYNEPHYYIPTNSTYTSKPYEQYQLWSDPADATAGLMPQMIKTVRDIAGSGYTILIDTVQLAKPECLAYQGISPDGNVVYSFHVYNPSDFVNIGQPGILPLDPDFAYPGHGQGPIGSPAGTPETIGALPNPSTDLAGAPFVINWQTGSSLLHTHQKERYRVDQWGFRTDGTHTNPTTGATIKISIIDYWSAEITQQMLHDYIAQARTWADSHGVRIIMGEFGATNVSVRATRVQWVTDVVAYAKALGIPRSWWAICGNAFGIRPKGTLTQSTAVYDANGYDTDLVTLLKP